jgi:cytochrome c oxidase subunit 2
MAMINLAADYGWGPYTLLLIFIVVVIVTTVGFFIVMATTKVKKKQSFLSKSKYHPETYWSIGVAAVLIWLWIISYPWMPPVAFNSIKQTDPVQIVNVTAGQWFWLMNRVDQHPQGIPAGDAPRVTVTAGQPVKFIAHSIDVHHGFGIFAGSGDGSPILLQMQIIPKVDNVFYYTFKNPGIYFIRCLEYCGYAHPYMTSEIKVISAPLQQQQVLQPPTPLKTPNDMKNNTTNSTLNNPSNQI